MAKKRSKKRSGVLKVLLGVILVLAVVFGIFCTLTYIRKYMPTKERVSLSTCYPQPSEDGVATIVDGEYKPVEEGLSANAILSNDVLYFRRGFLKDEIDNGYVFDDKEKILRYTTDKSIYSTKYDSTAYTIDGTEADLGVPATISAHETVYVALPYVEKITDINGSLHGSGEKGDPLRVVVFSAGFECQKATFARDTEVRRAGGPKSSIMANAKKGGGVYIIKDYDRWSSVVTGTGVRGYVRSNSFKGRKDKTFRAKLPARSYEHNLMGRQVRLGWHQVTNMTANGGLLDYIRGTDINVVSPTWFYLNDNAGGIYSLASRNYVNKAHARGVKVWGLISNFEKQGIDTTGVLNTTSKRDTLIKNIVWAAKVCGMDGINVDFEEVSKDAADGYIEFIRELSLRCEENALVLSVDNYVPEAYNDHYNRYEQGLYADYVIIMGYDEYYAGSESPGPTASLPYVEKGVEKTLKEVPAGQVILGMPFYSRLWTTENGQVSSKALSMNQMTSYISEHNLIQQWQSDQGLNYVEDNTGNVTTQMWVEDAQSLSKKLALMKDQKLGGCAFWKLGFEPASIWTVIKDYDY